MAGPGNPAWRRLGDMAIHEMGSDRVVAGVDLGVGRGSDKFSVESDETSLRFAAGRVNVVSSRHSPLTG